MRTVTFSRLRNQAKRYFDAVERGESVEVYRHGRPVAILMPVRRPSTGRWKTGHPLILGGASLSRAIAADRTEDR